MNYLLIRHKVANFDQWKNAYDAHAPARTRAGLRQEHVLRSVDDSNEVILLFATNDLKAAQEFCASSDLKEAMKNAGVVDTPDLYFLSR